MFLQNKPKQVEFVFLKKKTSCYYFTLYLLAILKIFLKPSIAVQAQTYPTINLIYPFILTIRGKLDTFLNSKEDLNLNKKIKEIEPNNNNKELNNLLKNTE